MQANEMTAGTGDEGGEALKEFENIHGSSQNLASPSAQYMHAWFFS